MVRRLSLGALFLTLIACGGAGGTSVDGMCDATTYLPNYATVSGMTLRHWTSVPIRVCFETSTPIGGTTIEIHIRNGFDMWELSTSENLWTEVGNPLDADLVVKVQSASPQSTLATTTVFFNTGTTIINRAEMVVYSWPSIPEEDYAATGAHEFGHAMGIGGHSNASLDIMYFTGNSSGLLTPSDLNTLRTIYCDFGASAPLTGPRTRAKGIETSETISCPANHVH